MTVAVADAMKTLTVMTTVAGALLAQTLMGAQRDTAFDVASVRPHSAAATSQLRTLPNGQLVATNVTVQRLIQRAYKLHDSQILGVPDWAAKDGFDVDARMANEPVGGPETMFTLLQPLLGERFALRAHMDTRELPAYVLKLKQQGRLGVLVRPTEADCTRAIALTQDEIRASVREGWPPCGVAFSVAYVMNNGSGEQVTQLRLRRTGTTMRDFAASLQDGLDRPVVDDTGLEGRFDVEYTYAPQPPTAATSDSPFAATAPGLFVALEEQLGMKLESRRARVPVLVIDRVERPTPN